MSDNVDLSKLVIRLGKASEMIDLRQKILRAGLPREAAMFEGDDDPTTLHAVGRDRWPGGRHGDAASTTLE